MLPKINYYGRTQRRAKTNRIICVGEDTVVCLSALDSVAKQHIFCPSVYPNKGTLFISLQIIFERKVFIALKSFSFLTIFDSQ